MATAENTSKIDPVPEQKANEPQVPPVGKLSLSTQWILIGGIIFLVLMGGLYFLKKSSIPQTLNKVPQVTQQAASPSAQPTKPRSKAPGIIVSIVTAKGVDPKTGEAVKPTTIFLTTDKNIYAVTTLKNAKVGTRIEYVRYLNNKFLDNRSIRITKLNTNNTSFVWALKNSTSTHPVGQYKVKVYTNGIFEKEISYIVQ